MTFTVSFPGDLTMHGNPFDVETVFGKPETIGIGDTFAERDALEDHVAVLTAALGALRTWLGIVAEKIDLDPDATRVLINAVGPDGKREVAARSLRDIYEQADAALAFEAGPVSSSLTQIG